jgi:hypothetical protein
MITLYVRYVEGDRKVSRYKTIEGAQRAAQARFGESPERGGGYVHDDYATLTCDGISFNDLFPNSWEAKEARQRAADEIERRKSMEEYEARVKAAMAPHSDNWDDLPF